MAELRAVRKARVRAIISPVSQTSATTFSTRSIGNICSLLGRGLDTSCVADPGQRETPSNQQAVRQRLLGAGRGVRRGHVWLDLLYERAQACLWLSVRSFDGCLLYGSVSDCLGWHYVLSVH